MKSRLLLLAVCTLSAIPSANAAINIITDAFTGTNGSTLNLRTPVGADLPSATYTVSGSGDITINSSAGAPAPAAQMGFNNLANISIASAGSYTKPSFLTISADIQMNLVVDLGGFARGVGLGFFSASGFSTDSANFFTGLTIKPDGTLRLVKASVEQAASVAPFSGFTTSSFYNLSYSLDTTTGSITNVTFNGNNDTAAFSGAASAGDFTNTITNLAGFYTSSASTALGGAADNFTVSTPTPEPTAIALLGIGAMALLGRSTRRRA